MYLLFHFSFNIFTYGVSPTHGVASGARGIDNATLKLDLYDFINLQMHWR